MLGNPFPPVEELKWGKELKEMWTSEGRDEGRDEGRGEERAAQLRERIQDVEERLKRYDRMLANNELSESSHHSLKLSDEQQLQNHKNKLEQLERELRERG